MNVIAILTNLWTLWVDIMRWAAVLNFYVFCILNEYCQILIMTLSQHDKGTKVIFPSQYRACERLISWILVGKVMSVLNEIGKSPQTNLYIYRVYYICYTLNTSMSMRVAYCFYITYVRRSMSLWMKWAVFIISNTVFLIHDAYLMYHIAKVW